MPEDEDTKAIIRRRRQFIALALAGIAVGCDDHPTSEPEPASRLTIEMQPTTTAEEETVDVEEPSEPLAQPEIREESDPNQPPKPRPRRQPGPVPAPQVCLWFKGE